MTKHCVCVQFSDHADLHTGAEAHGTLAYEHLQTSNSYCGLLEKLQARHLNSVKHIVIRDFGKPIETGDVNYEIQQEEKALAEVVQNPTRPVLYNPIHTEAQKPERRAMPHTHLHYQKSTLFKCLMYGGLSCTAWC